MADKHLKRLAAPSTWPVKRKIGKFVARPRGSFAMDTGMPLITVLKEVLNLVRTRKEGKLVLNKKEIIVNGKRRKYEKFMVGLMDVIGIKDIAQSYRVVLDKNRMLRLVPISDGEESLRLCKIIGKRTVNKGKVQLSLHDGRSYHGTNEHRVGDTLVLDLPKNDVMQHLRFETGSYAYLTGGSHVGCTGIVDYVAGNKVMIRIGDEVVESDKLFVFIIGKEKPLVRIGF